jgi:glycosyltransferase involved in cell wall biosynthesis
LLNRFRAAIGDHADRIVSNSPGGTDYWAARGFDQSRIEIIPNFVPVTEIEAAADLDDPRLGHGDELVLCVGRLNVEKNLDAVVDAMQLVSRSRPRARLAFCGEGPLLDTLNDRVRTLGLDGRVIFAGFVANVASWLKRAAVLVAVSVYEGHPNAVLEAMAAGVPAVVSDISAFRSILDADSAAFVSGRDVQAIAAAIVNALEDPEAAAQRAARARLGMASLSLESMGGRFEAAYQRAIAAAESAK